ncbi:MAG: TonB-dependent receptor [Bryobacteraceae bacterium]|nr:TonB-dependent receptor [Bryobacteraceae bacterium]
MTGSVQDPTGAPVAGATVEVFISGGASALLQSKTNAEGLFSFVALRPESYDVAVTQPGFAKVSLRKVKVDSLKETSLGVLKLEVASSSQVVEVSAEIEGVQLGNSELVSVIAREQLEQLPTASRQISTLFTTQAGVSDGRGATVINGMRTSAANVTLDGVNIQDNFIRTNSLDFIPIRPTIDQVSEMSLAVGNAGSTVGGGSAQVTLTTRSGSNQLHGSAYWFNQNEAYNANEFFSNRAGLKKPKLNQNQLGVSLGGRVIKDKLFYYGNFESLRLKQQNLQLRTVLVPDARAGNFLYRPTGGGAIQSVNVLAARNLTADPTIRAMIASLPNPNSTDAGDGILTSGYRFNARANTVRDQFVNRWDYYLNSSNSFTVSYNRTSEYNDRPDINTRFYDAVPPNFTDTTRNFMSVGWRSTISPTLTNELRGGFLRSPSVFNRVDAVPALLVTGTGTNIFNLPQNNFLSQGRFTNTYSLQDNASWLKGKHTVSFGMQTQWIRTAPYNDAGAIPTATLGLSAQNNNGLSNAQLPGVSPQDLTRANDYLATLAGFTTNVTQTFFVNNPSEGFAKGIGERRNFAYDTWALYLQDQWRVLPRLTLTMGLRYEYWTVLKEKNNLFLLPNAVDNNIISTVLNPNASFDFVNKNGRPLYNSDRNNFAPTIGFAYDLFGKGKTALRGSYGIAFINDDTLTAVRNNANTNGGLSTSATQVNLVNTLANVPSLSVSPFVTPIGLPALYRANPQVALGSPEFSLATPYTQMYTLGIQHEIKGTIIEARYVGNHGTKLLRAFDYNQVDIRRNGFLDDFRRIQANGNNPNTPGLTVVPNLVNPNLGSALNQQLLRQGEAGTLGSNLQVNGQQGTVRFFQNQNALGANVIANGANSTYNALQLEVRRRAKGVFFQANYTWSKVLSDTAGDDQNRFEPFLDNGNNSLERARAPFDLRQAFKFNVTYQLPFGAGQRFSSNRAVNHVIGGWTVSAVQSFLSGFPFSVVSNRGTLNRAARSNAGRNTATTNLTYGDITNKVFALNKTEGVLFVNPGYTLAGRGVNPDDNLSFPNQAFFNPKAGFVGNLQRRMFSGPTSFSLDMALLKRINFNERHSLEFGAQAFNLPNRPSFTIGVEQDINSVNFNRITGVNVGARNLQFSLYYRF